MYAVIKLKCSNHKMPIVNGRYSNIPVDERICNICPTNEVGDEFHYLFKCSYFYEDRKKYVKNYYYRHSNMYKLTELFNNINDKELLNLAKFVYIIISFFKRTS